MMGIASALMIHQYVYSPKRLDPTYVHFLNRQVQVPLASVKAVGQMQKGLPIDTAELAKALGDAFPAEKIDRYLASSSSSSSSSSNNNNKTPPYDSRELFTNGEMGALVLHPGVSFPKFVATFFLRGLKIAAPVGLSFSASPSPKKRRVPLTTSNRSTSPCTCSPCSSSLIRGC